jgi:serine/threonine-protein kinase
MDRPRRDTQPLWRSEARGRLTEAVLDGRYRLGRLLGTGGIGEVYAAVDIADGRGVAVKVLLPAFRDVSLAVKRFEREAKAGGLLDHPNVVDIYAFGRLADGTHYMVMEHVDGSDVATLLERGPLAPPFAFSIARQTLAGLAHAHALGVLHRDLKPENLMVVGDVVKILDLGLAKLVGFAAEELGADKLTETGAISGTPTYMAPEQVLCRLPTEATDLYTVGVILYEMLVGKPPFVGADVKATLRLQVGAPPPTLYPRFPATPALEAVIARALAKDPAARFASAREMAVALDAAT